jgi:hypothetical protein
MAAGDGAAPARGLLEHATEAGTNAWGDTPRWSWVAPGGVDRASQGPQAHVLFAPQRLHEVGGGDYDFDPIIISLSSRHVTTPSRERDVFFASLKTSHHTSSNHTSTKSRRQPPLLGST